MAGEPITKPEESDKRHLAVRRPLVLVIAGPTASGKSGLALALAADFPALIINADSMQVYRDLPILTAQPDAEAQKSVPHRLYGGFALDRRMDAESWAGKAAEAIAIAWQAERLPILVGGSGLYLKALMEGFAAIPDIPPAIRDEARALMQAIGPLQFHRHLAAIDPVAAAKLRPQDRQRLERAFCVKQGTGRSIVDWQSEPRRRQLPDARYLVLVTQPERDDLYRACDRRFLAMMEEGALQEVEAALAAYPAIAAKREWSGGFLALGFRELAAFLRGENDRRQAIAAAQQATRNYAKRQMTWFRHQIKNANFISPNSQDMKFSQSSIADLRQIIRNSLLTHS